jgi:hypothetical protein
MDTKIVFKGLNDALIAHLPCTMSKTNRSSFRFIPSSPNLTLVYLTIFKVVH